MTISTVTVNYSEAQTGEVIEQYTQGVSVENIATALGKSTRSIIAKLSKEGVYKPKAKVSASTRITKSQIIEKIAAKLGVPSEQLESLEKATKEALELVALACYAE